MRSRLRSLAALLALCALSLSVAGSAWAAMCEAAPPAAASAAEAHDGAHAHGQHHGGAPAPADHPGGPRSAGGDAPACPLMAPGAAGSCLGTFVAAAPAFRSASPDRETHDFLPPGAPRALLDASPPFRPPEA